MSSGRFIVFEGGEGSGKSTAAAAVAARLEAAGRRVVLTREPGGTPAGEVIRGLLHERLSPWAELFAFLTARAELVAAVIRPALERGDTVLCDRFAPSTFAYQVHARGLDPVIVRTANRAATGGLEPDLVVYLDIDPAAGLARKAAESAAVATGLEGLEFHRKVREGYLLQARDDAGRWAVIDAALPAERVAELAAERVLRLLG
ncbi:dTMP kinase [Tepidiforma flava]|uniref:Thymidylate kinase n=1 Tax=Tepidiforma flava TaxID=3004094 RepID=A0ABY7MBM0_9CHLR|nr:dTMP kinase [Tepidiforma flava]WBL37405.1 dTMP kinase [Tepidiforma flava]